MYKEHYGFKENPFSLVPDPEYLYLTKQHRLALTLLKYGIDMQAGLTVISGEVGSGKTTLIRRILKEMDDGITVGLISNAHSTFGDLLQWVLMSFDIKFDQQNKSARYKMLMDFLIQEYSKNKRTVLIIDEAQNMDVATLEELRLLSNINADKHLILQVVLVGQPELLELLRKPELRQLAQRVSVNYNLKALSYQETVEYIRYRLTIAGGENPIFDKYAVAAIFYHSGGIPRLINTLCDFALVYGFAEDSQQVDLNLIMDVIKDKHNGGIFPEVTVENKEQESIRQLILHDKKMDINKLDEEKHRDEKITKL